MICGLDCPDGYYKDSYYDGWGSYKTICKNCAYGCARCSNYSLYACQSCNNGYYL